MIERIFFYIIIFSQKRNEKRETHGRRGSSRIGIKFLTTYHRGEVARGHAGGGTDTILALLIDKDGGIGRGRVGDGKVRANQNADR